MSVWKCCRTPARLDRVKRLLLCLSLAACGPSFSFPEFRLATTPPASDHLGVNALVLQAEDTVEFKSDGSALLTRYRRVKVFTADGARAAEVHLPFSAKYRLNFFAGRVTVPVTNGADREEYVKTSEGHITRPLEAEGSREIGEVVYGFPDLAPGVVFDYVAIFRVPDAALIGPVAMRENNPVAHAEVTVLAPQDFDLDLRYFDNGQPSAVAPSKPSDAPSNGQAYRFVALDLPPLINEELAPAAVKTGPVVWPVVRKGGGIKMQRWEDVREWFEKRYALPPGAGSKTDEDALRAAFQKAALEHNVQSSGLTLGERATRVGHDRIEEGLRVYKSLRADGFAVTPALAAREEAGIVFTEVPSPASFDTVLVAYESNGKMEYLDPSCPSCQRDQVSPELEGAPVVAFPASGAKVEALPSRSTTDNAYVFTVNGTLTTHADISGAGTAILSGSPAAAGRAAYLRNDPSRLQDQLGFSKDAKLLQPKSPEGPPGQTFELGFDFVGHCKDEGNARLRCTPQNFFGQILPEVWREARTRDLLLPMAFAQQLVATLHVPTGKIDVPPPVQLKSKFGEYALGYKLDKDLLTVTRRVALTAHRIPSEDYEAFFKFLVAARKADMTGPAIDLFAEGEAPPPTAEPKKADKASHKKGKR